jgi:hypothetical protein
VLTHEGEQADPNSEATIESTTCVLHVFAEGAANTEAIVEAIKDAYDFVRLSISGIDDMGAMRLSYSLSPAGRATDADLVFSGQVQYLVRMNRVRTR